MRRGEGVRRWRVGAGRSWEEREEENEDTEESEEPEDYLNSENFFVNSFRVSVEPKRQMP